MRIVDKPMSFFIDKLKNKEHFAMVGYSDAEWNCILGRREGERTGVGQILSAEHGLLLADIIRRRALVPNFMFAVPRCLEKLPGFDEGIIDAWLQDDSFTAVERDALTDDLAAAGELYPFIRTIREIDSVCLVGPSTLSLVAYELESHHAKIETPNLHMVPSGSDIAVKRALEFSDKVYLVSAGVSAAVIIDKLYDAGRTAIDCGSIWDGFVGIGGQREWRRKLYADPVRLLRWRTDNLYGKGVNLERDQDRVYDLEDNFRKIGDVMFRQQRRIYEKISESCIRNNYTILEAGCGNGTGTTILRRIPFLLMATDKSVENIRFAKSIYPRIDFEVWDIQYPTKLTADSVVCIETIEHVQDPKLAIQNLIDAARQEVWISTPNGIGKPRPPSNPYHVCEYTPQEMLGVIDERYKVRVLDWETFEEITRPEETNVDPLVYHITDVNKVF